MLARTLALTCACLLGLAAGASAQTTPTAPPATTAPAGTPPASMPPAAAPPTATPPAAAMPPAATPTAATPPAAPAPAAATAPVTPPTFIRGTIAAVAPRMLTVNSRDGSKLEIALADPLTVRTLKRVPLSSVKDGAYLGIASREGPNGTHVALEVLVFPEAMRGAAAGHYAWNLQPGSMMTNAPVTGVASEKSGRDLTLTYQGGSIVIHVPPKAPVVTYAPASFRDLKPGRKVFLAARKGADGNWSTGAVTVGTRGVNPPM